MTAEPTEADQRYTSAGQDPAVSALQRLLQKRLPGMPLVLEDAEPGAERYRSKRENQDFIRALHFAITQHEPEAGRFYWSAQSWNMLCWQPIILTLTATCLFNRVPELESMAQYRSEAVVAGIAIPEKHFLPVDSSEQGILCAADQLRSFLDDTLNQLQQVMPLNTRLARRLFADRMLSTLLLLQQATSADGFPLLDNDALEVLADQWLKATGLTDASDLMRLPEVADIPTCRERLALDRKGCCQHFRRHDGTLCATCPRHRKEERIRLIQQSWATQAA